MTDRINSLTVVLEHNVRDDDIKPTIDAIQMIRGVQDVVPHVADHASYVSEAQARDDLRDMLWHLVVATRDTEKLRRVKAYLKEIAEA